MFGLLNRAWLRLLQPRQAHTGHTTAEAPDIGEAAGRLRVSLAPRLVLLDLMLPRMSAWEFLRARKKDLSLAGAPVLLLAEPGLLGQADVTAMGAVALLEKP